MPNYKYSALDKYGKKIEGKYTSTSKEDVLSMLRQNNYYPMKVEEDKGIKEIRIADFLKKIKTKDIAIFCRQFYTLLNAGITIISCLDILKLQTENKKFAKVIGEVHDDVQKGLTFSESLKKQKNIFPDLLINMVEAGEVSGNLDVIMERMAFHYEKENKINNKVKGAMAYPIILSIVAVAVVTFLLTFVMPTFVGMFESSGVELPLPTRILLSISEGIKKYWYIHLLILFLGIYGIIKYIKSERGKMLIGIINFRIPIIKGVTQKIITSRFTRTLSTLLSSGVPLIHALEIVAKIVGNIIVEKGILEAKEEVRKGIDLASPLERIGVFPPMVTSMIKIGEESGSLDEILEKTADFYDEELETALSQITTLIEPIMIIVMGGVVGFIVIAMMLPMFDMFNTIDM
ncbi:MAG: type II secretion system F family protein [Tepidibacter sp.]|jgi:type IV pilus assembly protein PilC|uniref:type II secretion system F family protein n=1 Tax=Tepidibacter sp. TaxID=2529387 RepID=UPI0025F3103E|nr:type II secretion system F family protein [Tepidibacter sp.]MCT4509429.1 type II secretion system F family protein [Tepidibacter sp.]